MDFLRRSILEGSLGMFASGAAPTDHERPGHPSGPGAQHGTAVIVASRREAVESTFSDDTRVIWVSGYSDPGDDGEGLYRLVARRPPAHDAWFSSRDGKVWELAESSIVRPEQFGAKGDARLDADGFLVVSAGTDDQAAFDQACAYLVAQPLAGGTIQLGARTYTVSLGVRLNRHVSLVGHPGASRIYKVGPATRPISPEGVAASGIAAVVHPDKALAQDINAVLILDGEGGRWIGRIEHVTLQGPLEHPDNWESQYVDFGIVSVGSVSDSKLSGITINAVKQALLLPDVFTTEISLNRANRCLRGLGINKGTSLNYVSNYSSSCRDYGHAIRDVMYSKAYSNAVDNLNDPAIYPDRGRKCTAYILAGLVCVEFHNNGQEQTYGSSFYIDVVDNCSIEENIVIGLGSDYSGAEHIAVWDLTGYEFNTTIKNNAIVGFSDRGAIQGRAASEFHHFVYCRRDVVTAPRRSGFRFEGNTFRADRVSRSIGSGWGNSVAMGWQHIAQGRFAIDQHKPSVGALVNGDLITVYNGGNQHWLHVEGEMIHAFGCFDFTLSHSNASGLLAFGEFPGASGEGVLGVVGREGRALPELAYFKVLANGSALIHDKNGEAIDVEKFPSGEYKIYYDGWYRPS